jgi:hypothetical protein
MHRRFAIILPILPLAFIAGCGGGSSSSTPSGPPESVTISIYPEYDHRTSNYVAVSDFTLYVDNKPFLVTQSGYDNNSPYSPIISTGSISLSPGVHTISVASVQDADEAATSSPLSFTQFNLSVSGATAFTIGGPEFSTLNETPIITTQYGPLWVPDGSSIAEQEYFTITVA